MQEQRISRKIILGVAAVALAALAQQDNPRPTCNRCPATYIANSELQAYTQRAIANRIVDQQVRSVDIGKSQVGVGIVYRGRLAPGQGESEPVAEHDQISEVYHIIEGSATLATGPDLVGSVRRPSTLQTVREFNGPGHNAKSIVNPVTYELKPGDVIVIPAGTGHWFTKIDDHILYLMVRIDPDKVVPLKDEAASKAYLASPVATGKKK
jgi:mannose-6-phosphate isomerase-like protein (cupin superfamily)